MCNKYCGKHWEGGVNRGGNTGRLTGLMSSTISGNLIWNSMDSRRWLTRFMELICGHNQGQINQCFIFPSVHTKVILDTHIQTWKREGKRKEKKKKDPEGQNITTQINTHNNNDNNKNSHNNNNQH